MLCTAWSFWTYEQENSPSSDQEGLTTDTPKGKWTSFKKIISNKPTLLGALFIFAYQGSEVSISGWVISFLVTYRGGDPTKVGYVTSGFWGGITVGRFALSPLGSRIGERNFVFAIVAGAFVLQFLVWFVPSVLGDSIAVGLAGLLLGPIYPSATVVFARLIPQQMQMSAFSVIASVGSSGGAFVPFMTGLLSQEVGTWVLHPICIGAFVAMEAMWFLLPKVHKRTE